MRNLSHKLLPSYPLWLGRTAGVSKGMFDRLLYIKKNQMGKVQSFYKKAKKNLHYPTAPYPLSNLQTEERLLLFTLYITEY